MRLLCFFDLWCFFKMIISTLVEMRALKKILVSNFQPSLLQKILSRLENGMLEWEVSDSHNNN